MHTSRRTAGLVGFFFLFSNFTFLIGAAVFIEPVLSASDYLTLIASSQLQLTIGALLEIANGIAYLGIAALMFPILKSRFESLALSYLAFRIIEFVMQIAASLSPLILLTLSQELAGTGATAGIGAILLAGRFWANQMISLTFGLGALLFYTMLLRAGLIPRFISIWGLLGAALVLINLLLDLFGVNLGAFSNLGILMLLNELFLGVWLIIKGFNPAASLNPQPGSSAPSRLAGQA